MPEKKDRSITIHLNEKLSEGYNYTLSESDREEWRTQCRMLLAKMLHNKTFKKEDWE